MTAAPRPNLQPRLIGALAELAPMRAEDWDEMYAVGCDPLIWAVHPAPTRYQHDAFRAFFDAGLACSGAFAIRDRTSGAIIGSSRYFGHDAAAREIEIGWTFLARAYWGGAYNREIKRLMIGHAFTFVDTVIFRVGAANWRSRRAMEKIGGILRPGTIETDPGGMGGPPVTHVVYEIGNRTGWEIALAPDAPSD
jgi:RimJ/RimL family protein N-acetyltransferase